MKKFLNWGLILAIALAWQARAADSGPAAKIIGTVVDAKGQPVADAAVDCYQYPSGVSVGSLLMDLKQHTTTDSKGAFSLPAAQATATMVVAKKAGLAPAWKTWILTRGDSTDPLVLTAPTALAGVVVDDQDKPVADADVWVAVAITKGGGASPNQPNILTGKPARDNFAARTSADGHFRIENFPSDAEANMGVTAAAKALRVAGNNYIGVNMLQARSGKEDIKLVVLPAGAVEGKVAVSDSGQPLSGVQISLQSTMGGFNPGDSGTPNQTGADGTFHIPNVAPGSYRVVPVFMNQPVPDWVAESQQVTVKAGETARDIQIRASKGGMLEVTVLGADDHRPIAGAGVSAYSQALQAGSVSGANGVAVLRLLPGQVSISANKEGWSQANTQATVDPGVTNRAEILLTPPLKITGTLRDASGAPVVGARLTMVPNYFGNNTDVKSDATGHYEFPWQKGNFGFGGQNMTFSLIARSLDRNLAAMHEIDENNRNLDLTLTPGLSISARIEDPSGKPITSASGGLTVMSGNNGSQINPEGAKADDQGRIRIDALPQGENFSLYITANGFGSANRQLSPGDSMTNHYDFPTFVLKVADRKLAGQVLGPDGKPAVGAQVNINGVGQPNGFTQTDDKGHFAFEAVCEGPVTLFANFNNSYGNTRAQGGATNVVLRLNNNNNGNVAQLTLSGTVVDSSGAPAADVRLTVMPAFGMNGEVRTDSSGKYTLTWQPQRMGGPNSKFYLVARDLGHNLATAQEIDEKKTNVDVRLLPGFALSGSVQDVNGKALDRATVQIIMTAGNMGTVLSQQPTRVDAQGTFTVNALPQGQQYSLTVSCTGYGTDNKPVNKAQSQTDKLNLPTFKLKIADRQLAGQVVGADDKPVSGAQVQINGQGQPNGNTQSDSTGHFLFRQVCEGPVRIFAYDPNMNGGPMLQGNVQAQGGDTNVLVKLGVNQARAANAAKQAPARTTLVKEQPWTATAVRTWPARHKAVTITLISLQVAALVGTAAGILVTTRPRGSGPVYK